MRTAINASLVPLVMASLAACQPGPASAPQPSSSASAASSASVASSASSTSAGAPASAQDGASAAELSPALAPLAWWLGDWDAEGGKGSEHWVAAAGAVYGIALGPVGHIEVMIIDDGDGPGKPDGILRLFAMPGIDRSVEFRAREVKGQSATFANDAHDYPKAITYSREGDNLVAITSGGGDAERFAFKRAAASRAPELEAADIAFDAATAERGVDGWVASFGPDGAMMRRGSLITGPAAIGEAMKPLLSSGQLRWAPIASGKSGDFGFTVGKAKFTGQAPDDSWRSTYVTIWRRAPDGSWKVRFDTGRGVQE